MFFCLFVLFWIYSIRELIRQVRKRMKRTERKIAFHALVVTETLVLHCGVPVHKEVATVKFMKRMLTLMKSNEDKRGHDSLAIVDKVLELIQAWYYTFLGVQVQTKTSPLHNMPPYLRR
jgi:hypothetical protein